jgi:hypothetical protein
MSLALIVNNVPLVESLDLFVGLDRALLSWWLRGFDVDAGFEVLTWSRVATRNDNGRRI